MAANGTNGVHASLVKDQSASAPLSTVLKPNDLDAVPELTENIKTLGGGISIKDDSRRRELLAQARRLVQALETPRETMIKHCWAQVGFHPSSNREQGLKDNSRAHTWPSQLV